MEIHGIGFDVDGTLYPHFHMLRALLPAFLAAPFLSAAFRKARREIRDLESIENFREVQAAITARFLNRPAHEVMDAIERKLYRRWRESFRSIRPFRDLRPVLCELRRKGYKLGILSDFPIDYKLETLGVADCWDVVLSSEEIGFLKPDPRAFLKFAETMEIAPQAILFVGNNYKYDIMGAAKVGMKTAWLKGGKAAADINFSAFRELEKKIRTAFG